MKRSEAAPQEAPGDRSATTSSRGTVLMALRVLAAAFVLFCIYVARTDFHVLPREDTIECVVVAEEINAGHGMTTRVISPSVLTFLQRQGRAKRPWPNALRSPLPCLLIAWFSRVASEPVAVALSSGIFFILSVPVIFLIGQRLSGRAAGLIASGAYALSPGGLWFGVTGLTESATIFSLASITYLMIPPLTWQGCLVAGIAAGIGYLARSTFKIWAVLIVAYILWRSREAGWGRALGRAALFLAPLLIAIVWWSATIGGMTGKFGYSGQEDIIVRLDTDLYPGRSPGLTLESWSPREFILAHKTVMAKKYARLAERAWPAVANMGGLPFLICFFLAELFVVLSGGKRVGVHWLVYGLLLVQMLMVPLASEGHGGVSADRYLDPFGPLAAVLGAAFAVELLRRYEVPLRKATLPVVGILLLTALPIMSDLAVGPYHARAAAQSREVGDYLAAKARPGDVVAATDAAVIAWTSGLDAIYLPMTPEEFLRMDREMQRVDWVYIRERGGDNAARTEAWKAIMAGDEELPGFQMDRRFPDGAVLLKRTSSQ